MAPTLRVVTEQKTLRVQCNTDHNNLYHSLPEHGNTTPLMHHEPPICQYRQAEKPLQSTATAAIRRHSKTDYSWHGAQAGGLVFLLMVPTLRVVTDQRTL